ncbi:MAG: glyoxalase [Ponticaulis sp.]|nr:glyoxalase [Ponticaulis sp.]
MTAAFLDHFVILVPDLTKGVETYQKLLGRACDWQHVTPSDGTATAQFHLANTSVELLAPSGDGPVGSRIIEILDGREGVLSTLAVGTEDIGDAHFTAMRRGLKPGDVSVQEARFMGQRKRWSKFRCEDPSLGDVKLFMTANEGDPRIHIKAPDNAASRVDHLVVNTGNPDRAMAVFGAKLGIRLALDRTNPDWGARFLFFRLGETTIEFVSRLDGSTPPTAPDALWGVTYEVPNLEATHTRLTRAGVEVTEVKKGRHKGTRVMRVHSGCLSVPTLFLDNNG